MERINPTDYKRALGLGGILGRIMAPWRSASLGFMVIGAASIFCNWL
jgi:hypothetical protein